MRKKRSDSARNCRKNNPIRRLVPCLRLLCPEYRSIELLDPRFARVLEEGFTFGGFEIAGVGGNQYLAQTWMVQFDALTPSV